MLLNFTAPLPIVWHQTVLLESSRWLATEMLRLVSMSGGG